MKNQQQITEACKLLNEDGTLTQQGYATRPLWQYDRKGIKASWHRIKEWDYYAVLSQESGYGITFTVSDLSYIGVIAVCWLDFKNRTSTQYDTMTLLPRGRTDLPSTPQEGITSFKDNKFNFKFDVGNGKRVLTFDVPGFVGADGEKGLKGEILLQQDPEMDNMVIATSWEENRKAFYYNQKTNCMPAEGSVKMGKKIYPFSPETSLGVLDWGRGNWTYKNRWYWGSASGWLEGNSIGWNLGYGFSDRSVASENMLFFKGKAHKLDKVTFQFNSKNYMEPWQFTSNDKRFEMTMKPLIDRDSMVNLGLIKSVQHQIFGNFTGDVVLDDGTSLHVDNMLGFAEDVLNWW